MSIKPLIDPTPTISWNDGKVLMIDQTLLPLEESYIETDDFRVVCKAIYQLSIRGAPAIGVATICCNCCGRTVPIVVVGVIFVSLFTMVVMWAAGVMLFV